MRDRARWWTTRTRSWTTQHQDAIAWTVALIVIALLAWAYIARGADAFLIGMVTVACALVACVNTLVGGLRQRIDDLEADLEGLLQSWDDVDTCRPVEVDGQTIRVHGAEEMTDEDRGHFATIVRAVQARMALAADVPPSQEGTPYPHPCPGPLPAEKCPICSPHPTHP